MAKTVVPPERKQGKKPLPSERRRAKRYPLKLETVYRPTSTSSIDLWRSAKIRNISIRGIGLLLPRPFEAGAVLEIELENSAQSFFRILQVRVIHMNPMRGSSWAAGCAFTRKLTPKELQALI